MLANREDGTIKVIPGVVEPAALPAPKPGKPVRRKTRRARCIDQLLGPR